MKTKKPEEKLVASYKQGYRDAMSKSEKFYEAVIKNLYIEKTKLPSVTDRIIERFLGILDKQSVCTDEEMELLRIISDGTENKELEVVCRSMITSVMNLKKMCKKVRKTK